MLACDHRVDTASKRGLKSRSKVLLLVEKTIHASTNWNRLPITDLGPDNV